MQTHNPRVQREAALREFSDAMEHGRVALALRILGANPDLGGMIPLPGPGDVPESALKARARAMKSECPICGDPVDSHRSFATSMERAEFDISGLCGMCQEAYLPPGFEGDYSALPEPF